MLTGWTETGRYTVVAGAASQLAFTTSTFTITAFSTGPALIA